MVNFTTYNSTQNITGFSSAIDYTTTAFQTAVGYDVFGITILFLFALGFYVIGSKFTQERALLFTTFMTLLTSFLMVSGHYLHPTWMLLSGFAFLLAVFFAGTRTG